MNLSEIKTRSSRNQIVQTNWYYDSLLISLEKKNEYPTLHSEKNGKVVVEPKIYSSRTYEFRKDMDNFFHNYLSTF